MSKNSVADIMKVVAVIIAVLGVIGSFVLGNAFPIVEDNLFSVETKYNWGVALTGIFCSVIAGLLFFGFGEIIALLQANLDAQKQSLKTFLEIKEEEKNEKNARPISMVCPTPTPSNDKSSENSIATANYDNVSNQTDVTGNNKVQQQTKEYATGEKVVPLPTNLSSEIQCPVCGQKQRNTRQKCFKCGAEFTDK